MERGAGPEEASPATSSVRLGVGDYNAWRSEKRRWQMAGSDPAQYSHPMLNSTHDIGLGSYRLTSIYPHRSYRQLMPVLLL